MWPLEQLELLLWDMLQAATSAPDDPDVRHLWVV